MPLKRDCCLYPTPGFNVNSAVDTLTRWVDGERIYRSTFVVPVLDGVLSTTAHGIAAYSVITKIYGIMIDDALASYPVPYADVFPATDVSIGVSVDATNIYTIASGVTPNDDTMYVIVEYTIT